MYITTYAKIKQNKIFSFLLICSSQFSSVAFALILLSLVFCSSTHLKTKKSRLYRILKYPNKSFVFMASAFMYLTYSI